MLRSAAWFVAGLWAVGLAGCGAGSPQGTLQSYAAAVEADDAGTAYRLLSREYRERVDEEAFAERFEAQQNVRSDVVAGLEASADELAFVDASLSYSEFDTLKMTLTHEGWRIEEGLFNFYGQRTPRETLYSFIKAVERRKYDVLMRFVPDEFAAQMSPELIQEQFEANPAQIDEMIALLRQNKDNIIDQKGKSATMSYGPYRVDFVQEDGVWKVADPD